MHLPLVVNKEIGQITSRLSDNEKYLAFVATAGVDFGNHAASRQHLHRFLRYKRNDPKVVITLWTGSATGTHGSVRRLTNIVEYKRPAAARYGAAAGQFKAVK
ncbi:MAG: hypothetical protein JWP89_7092 [Schlesneria sp.]|nr:hypothetical protein [Schlesneria sp.]